MANRIGAIALLGRDKSRSMACRPKRGRPASRATGRRHRRQRVVADGTGREIFRYDSFGSEHFWGDKLHLHLDRENQRNLVE